MHFAAKFYQEIDFLCILLQNFPLENSPGTKSIYIYIYIYIFAVFVLPSSPLKKLTPKIRKSKKL